MGGALCGVTAATGGLRLDAVVGASVGLRLYERRRAAVETVAAHVPLLGAARAFGGGGGLGGVCVVGVLWAGVGAREVVDVSMRCDRNHGVVLAAAGSGGTHRRRDGWGAGKSVRKGGRGGGSGGGGGRGEREGSRWGRRHGQFPRATGSRELRSERPRRRLTDAGKRVRVGRAGGGGPARCELSARSGRKRVR